LPNGDPFVAAFVTAFLLVEQFLQALHQLVEAAHLFDLRFLFRAEIALQLLFQPVERHVQREIGLLRNAVEIRAERLIELVEILLVLHERHAREIVELVQRRLDHAFLQRFEQRQVFLHGNGQLRGAQRVEKVDQHAGVSVRVRLSLRRDQRLLRFMNTSRSNRLTSCSFFSSAPCSGGTICF
jgi:hypothetical protein